jgi:hypothetical protein
VNGIISGLGDGKMNSRDISKPIFPGKPCFHL